MPSAVVMSCLSRHKRLTTGFPPGFMHSWKRQVRSAIIRRPGEEGGEHSTCLTMKIDKKVCDEATAESFLIYMHLLVLRTGSGDILANLSVCGMLAVILCHT